MATIEVRLVGNTQVYAELGTIAPLVLEQMLRQAVQIGVDAAKIAAPSDTNALVESIVGSVTGFNGLIESDSLYAVPQEIGRRAGSTMPPADAIAEWAARHGFDTSRSGLYLLARSIAENGFEGHHFMEAGMKEIERRFSEILMYGAEEINVYWGSEL